jgi:hypothetical protein
VSTLRSPRAPRLRAPSWLDTRLVLGVLLVLTSVALGARTLAGADRADPVWAVRHAVAAGTPLAEEDLTVVRVRLFDAGPRYVRASGAKPVGYVLDRPLGAGELVPRAALAPTTPGDTRFVTIPVAQHHFPRDLARGELVDVYVSRKTRGAGALEPASLVLAAVPVVSVDAGGGRLGSTSEAGVVLSVPGDSVAKAVSAVQAGAIDIVRVPRPPAPASVAGDR